MHYVRTSRRARAVTTRSSSTRRRRRRSTNRGSSWNGDGWDLTLKDGTILGLRRAGAARSRSAIALATRSRSPGRDGALALGIGNDHRGSHRRTGGGLRSPTTAATGSRRRRTTSGARSATNTTAADDCGRSRTPRGGVTEYTYDIAHRMLTIKDPRSIVYLTNEYDVNGRVSKQTQADGGDVRVRLHA